MDIPTDGEIRRENYIHYHCRHLDGFDFDTLTPRTSRDGGWVVELPSIVGPVAARAGEHFLPHDWRAAQALTEHPVKVTIPGPLTIMDSTADLHYDDRRRLGRDLADAINHEVRALADAGQHMCTMRVTSGGRPWKQRSRCSTPKSRASATR